MQTIKLPWPPKELNPNKKLHWAVKSKFAKAYREQCRLLTLAAKLDVPQDGNINLWITFYPPDRRHRDDDNMISAFKSGRDGIADALQVNDKRFRIHPHLDENIGGYVEVGIDYPMK